MTPQLEEKIYSLVPELKELTLGCKVKSKEGISTVISKGDEQYNFLLPNGWIGAEEHIGDLEIIGQEIFPHHWLPLLEKHSLTYYGHLMKWDNGDVNEATYKYLDIIYDFKKPLSEQSEELRQFLFDNLQLCELS